MKILAPFDQTEFSQATLPLLARLADLPAAEFTLLTVAHAPSGTRQVRGERQPVQAVQTFDRTFHVPNADLEPRAAETKQQAIERVLAELEDYLRRLAGALPSSAKIQLEAHVSESPATSIVECARRGSADVIVMATHSRRALARAVLGSTTEDVVRSGAAPVLVVHPVGDD